MSKKLSVLDPGVHEDLQAVHRLLDSARPIKVTELIKALNESLKVNSELKIRVFSQKIQFVMSPNFLEEAEEALVLKRAAIKGIKEKLAKFEQEEQKLAANLLYIRMSENSKAEQQNGR